VAAHGERGGPPARYRPGAVRLLGVLLLLPLAGTLAGSVVFTATCEYDCGDMGGRGLFILLLLCTPPAAAGVLVLAATGGGMMGRLVTRAAVGAVALCTVVLAGAALAAGIEGISELAGEPEVHRIGQTEPSQYERDQAREAGLFWLVIATVLAAMALTAALALWAAWKKRRGLRTGHTG
jgi:hypothetical protein